MSKVTMPFPARLKTPMQLDPVLLGNPAALSGYKVTHIPTTLVVEPGGVVKNVWVGQLPEDVAARL